MKAISHALAVFIWVFLGLTITIASIEVYKFNNTILNLFVLLLWFYIILLAAESPDPKHNIKVK